MATPAWQSAPAVESTAPAWQSAPAVEAAPKPEEGGVLSNLGKGIAKGFEDTGLGAAHLITSAAENIRQNPVLSAVTAANPMGFFSNVVPAIVAAVYPDAGKDLSQYIGQRETQYQQETPGSIAAGVGRFAGSAASQAPLLPGGVAAKGLGGALKQASAMGAASGALAPQGDVTANVALGAVAGPVIAGAARGGVSVANKVYNTLVDNIPQGIKEQMAFAAKNGIDLAADALQNSGVAKLLGKFVGGVDPDIAVKQVAGVINNQVSNQRDSMLKLLNNARADNSEWLTTLANSADPKASAARGVLAQLSAAGKDYNRIVGVGGSLELLKRQLTAAKNYDALETAVNALPAESRVVSVMNTDRAISKALSEMTEDTAAPPNQALVSYLAQLQDTIANNPMSFNVLRQTRSDLGSKLADMAKGQDALVGTPALRAITQIRKSLESDLANFAQDKPGKIAQLAAAADKHYKMQVAPYHEADIAKALANSDPEAAYNFAIQSPANMDRVLSLVGPEGREALQVGFTQNLFNKINKEQGTNTSLRNVVNAIQDTLGNESEASVGKALFSPSYAQYLTGLSKLAQGILQTTKPMHQSEAEKAMAYLGRHGIGPTGGAVTGLLTGGPVGAVIGGALGLLTPLSAKWLLTSQRGKQLLLGANTLKPNSPAMQRLIKTAIIGFNKSTGEDQNGDTVSQP